MSGLSRTLFWTAVHRYLGLATLVFLAIAALTGCVLAFAKPLDAALNADLFSRAPAATIDPVAAVTALTARQPSLRVIRFPLHLASDRNLEVDVASGAGFDQVYLDGGDGHVVGTRTAGPGWDRRHIVAGIFAFHFTLLAGDLGRWVMGVAALGWLIGSVVGFYLTLPGRPPFWRNWRRTWTFRWRSMLPRLLLDIHRSSGLWLFIGLLILAATSVAMNFFDEAFTPMVNAASPARSSPFDGIAVGGPVRVGYDQVIKAAKARAIGRGLDWRPAFASYVVERNLFGVSFTDDGVENYRRLGPITYWFDGASGRFAYEDNPYTDSAGRALSRSLYPLHTGEVAGRAGVAVVFVLGLATLEMCGSGAYVWWRKRRSRLTARKATRRIA